MMHEQARCRDEAANHQLPIAVAFWIIWIVSTGECSRLPQNLMQIHCSTRSVTLNATAFYMKGLSRISPAIVNIAWHRCKLGAKESRLECAYVNSDDFTVSVIGGGRCRFVSTWTVGPSHSKWLSEEGNESASDLVLSLNLLLWKLFRWFRRLQLWATGDWQLHYDNAPTHASCLLQSFLVKGQIAQVTQPHYSLDLAPWDFWLFPKLKSPLKRKIFHTIYKIKENMLGQLMDTERIVWDPKVPALKGLRHHCPMYSVSYSLYLHQ